MEFGVLDPPLPPDAPFRQEIGLTCQSANISRSLVYAVGWNETLGEYGAKAADKLQDGADPVTQKMPDGGDAGHGVFQLTSSWPPNWSDPVENCRYAINNFIRPAMHYWAAQGYRGEQLVLLTAAEFNAGRENVTLGLRNHEDPDIFTTARYGRRAVINYAALAKFYVLPGQARVSYAPLFSGEP